jgi:hypothetical protein
MKLNPNTMMYEVNGKPVMSFERNSDIKARNTVIDLQKGWGGAVLTGLF